MRVASHDTRCGWLCKAHEQSAAWQSCAWQLQARRVTMLLDHGLIAQARRRTQLVCKRLAWSGHDR